MPLPSGVAAEDYANYTEADWAVQTPAPGCNCGYCTAYAAFHSHWSPSPLPLTFSTTTLQATMPPIPQVTEIWDDPYYEETTQNGGPTIPPKKKKKEEDNPVIEGIKLKSSLELSKELVENKVLYLIRGAPGSGKSTLAYLIALAFRKAFILKTVLYETDDFFHRSDGQGNSLYFFELDKLPEAHEGCQNKVRGAMSSTNEFEEMKIIIVSNPFVSRQHLLPYQKLAREFGYKVVEIVCKSNFDNVHGVPHDKVRSIRQGFEN